MKNQEIKIEDFISPVELANMTKREREIFESVFRLNKEKLQNLTDTLDLLNDVNKNLDKLV